MSKLVITVIPEQDDQVWKISSEKVPHLTLLFLGDVDAVPHTQEIVEFVEHAATTIDPFYMDTEYRGTLGDDEADVIFFEKGWDFKAVSAFRNHLLTNSYIKQAYNSVDQFPEWRPHLTLGYPATPAKTPDPERRIHAVSFDRIAVWFGDFEGPEFRLSHKPHDAPEVSMGSMTRAEADQLLHFGVKGMKWGTRKTVAVGEGSHAGMVTPKKAAKLEKNYEKRVTGSEGYAAVRNMAADHVNARIGGVNDKYGSFTPKDYGMSPSPRYKQYEAEVQKLARDGLEKGVNQLYSSPTGKRKTNLRVDEATGDWHLTVDDIKHSDVIRMLVIPIKNKTTGLITGLTFKEEPTLTQGEEFVEGLFHYGVRGMKWGKRREPVGDGSVSVSTGVTEKGQATVNVKGGSGAPAHKDAIGAAKTRAVLDKSGTNALSNKELRDLSQRINLERQIGQLTVKPKSKPRQYVESVLLGTGNQQVRAISNDQASKQVKKMMIANETRAKSRREVLGK